MQIRKWIAVGLAVLISIPTIIEGGSVLLGISHPDQIVLKWLVFYNVVMAIISLLVAAMIAFRYSGKAAAARLIFFGHLSVLIILIGIHFTTGQVALKSIGAMSMRSTIWLVINILIWKR